MQKRANTLDKGAPTTAAAARTCWNFANLAEDTTFRIGDVIETAVGSVELKHYVLNGNKADNSAALAKVTHTQIAGDAPPELRTYLINCHVEPDPPVSLVTFQFGHLGPDGRKHANIGVNGDLREVTDSLASLNGAVLGRPALGTVDVTVSLNPPGEGQAEVGTVELRARTGSIGKFTVGGVQLFLKNVCLTS
jgi:hypothetical protein